MPFNGGCVFLPVLNTTVNLSFPQLPTVELKSVGPSIDFVLRRTKLADADNYRRACVIPKQIANVGKYGKNISRGICLSYLLFFQRYFLSTVWGRCQFGL